jgi:eukaryotic-like serine/threonine-protein kinase
MPRSCAHRLGARTIGRRARINGVRSISDETDGPGTARNPHTPSAGVDVHSAYGSAVRPRPRNRMHTSTFQHLRQVFDALVDLTPEQRIAEIEARSDLDDATRGHLRELLQIDAASTHLTASPALPLLRASVPRIGVRVGPYRVEAVLGEGGMGSVYRASRIDGGIEQQVAIKIARRDLLDDTALARFRIERQVLALLQHPHIAAMYDVGELDDGTPYIVMEYVQGRPLLEDAKARGLDLRSKLELFLLLCDAVAYAHRNLIVHRDIKPGNVLVTAEGRPKLLDFGIAKPLQQRLGAIAIEQTAMAQRYFSLRNAAPEQLRGDAIDVTCDVYGLGSVLYELLCGQPLYDFEGMTLGSIERCIAEDDPLPPSERVHASGTVTRQRRLPRELDAVTLKALRRDPQERYPSVDAFAADIRRYLRGYPVSAGDASVAYRVSRFVRRHRVAVTTSVLFAIVVGVGVVSWLRQYSKTLAERDRAANVSNVIIRAVATTTPSSRGVKEITARELFDQVGRLAVAEHAVPQRATRVQLATTAARIRYHLGQPEPALALLAQVERDVPLVPASLRDEFEATRADAYIAVGDMERATTMIASNASNVTSDASRVRWQMLDATVSSARGDHERALGLLRAIIAPESAASRDQRWEAQHELGYVLLNAGENEAALGSQLALLAEQRTHFSGAHPEVLSTLGNALFLATYVGHYTEAERLSAEAARECRAIYGESAVYPCIEFANMRAEALAAVGRLNDAEQEARDSLSAVLDHTHGESEMSAQIRYTLADILRRRGDTNETTAALRETVRVGELFMSSHSFKLMSYRSMLIAQLLRNGDIDDARRAAAAAESVLANDSVLARTEYAIVISVGRMLAAPQSTDANACSAGADQAARLLDSLPAEPAVIPLTQMLADVAHDASPDTAPWQRGQTWRRYESG